MIEDIFEHICENVMDREATIDFAPAEHNRASDFVDNIFVEFPSSVVLAFPAWSRTGSTMLYAGSMRKISPY